MHSSLIFTSVTQEWKILTFVDDTQFCLFCCFSHVESSGWHTSHITVDIILIYTEGSFSRLGCFLLGGFIDCLQFIFIYTFFCCLLLHFFTWSNCIQKICTRSIWPRDETLTATTTPGQSKSGNYGNKRVHHISQIFWTRDLAIRCSLLSYPKHLSFDGEMITTLST